VLVRAQFSVCGDWNARLERVYNEITDPKLKAELVSTRAAGMDALFQRAGGVQQSIILLRQQIAAYQSDLNFALAHPDSVQLAGAPNYAEVMRWSIEVNTGYLELAECRASQPAGARAAVPFATAPRPQLGLGASMLSGLANSLPALLGAMSAGPLAVPDVEPLSLSITPSTRPVSNDLKNAFAAADPNSIDSLFADLSGPAAPSGVKPVVLSARARRLADILNGSNREPGADRLTGILARTAIDPSDRWLIEILLADSPAADSSVSPLVAGPAQEITDILNGRYEPPQGNDVADILNGRSPGLPNDVSDILNGRSPGLPDVHNIKDIVEGRYVPPGATVLNDLLDGRYVSPSGQRLFDIFRGTYTGASGQRVVDILEGRYSEPGADWFIQLFK
jgi:hypothetical protein